MGYRGADSRRQQPWQSSSGAGQTAGGSWDDGTGVYGQDDGYAAADGYGGYPQDDSYAGYEGYGNGGEYGTTNGYAYGYDQGNGYDQGAGYDQGNGYGQSGGYGQLGDYGQSGDYDQGNGYGQSGGYGDTYQDGGFGSGPYQRQEADSLRDTGGRHARSGDYPALGAGSGGQPAMPGRHRDAGNDWYSGQPAAASGSGFADTGVHNFGAQATDSYRTGPRRVVGDLNGYDQGSRDPVRGFPPAPARPRPQLEAAAPQGLAHTGQQERYDDTQYDAYPVYTGQDGYGGQDGYDSGGYGSQGGYQSAQGYDEYDAPQAFDTRAYDTGRGYDSVPDYQTGLANGDYQDVEGPYQERYGDDGSGPHPARTGRARNGGKRSKRPLVLSAVAVVAIGVLGAAAYKYELHKPKQPVAAPTTQPGPLPTGSAAAAATAKCAQFGLYCHITMRTDDPTPLTLAEVFPPAFTNVTDKTSFTRITTKLDKTCANAVIGQDLISALKSDACTQVLRASYVSGDGKIMGTIGVVNLATTNDAHHAGKVVGANDFIAPLNTKTGIGKKLGSGTGVVEAEFKGHYLILTWAEYTSGKVPSTTAQDQALEQFEADLVAGSANIALSERMVNGTPASAPN